MEYSFAEAVDGTISLAFFERGRKYRTGNTGCILSTPAIQQTAEQILTWINEKKIPNRSLKSLILRSNAKGETIAALFIKDRLEFSDFPSLSQHFVGFHLYYSTHKSPASVPTALLYSAGQDYLIETLKNTQLKYGLLSFFQINTPIIEQVLADIQPFLDAKKPLLDFYSGVGTLSLPLHGAYTQATLVDNNAEAIAYAKENITLNHRPNCTAECIPAEKITTMITGAETIMLDPPRAGLHTDVVKQLLKTTPERIIYLSCNIATHARDIQLLSPSYTVEFLRLYNFFPRTPHIESLAVLTKK